MTHAPVAVGEVSVGDRRPKSVRGIWSGLARNRSALVGTIITGLFVLTGIAGLIIIAVPSLNHLYLQQDLIHTLAPPQDHGVFGTDRLGRDVFFRIVAGVGVSLAVGTIMATTSIIVGGIAGLLAGYCGGKIDLVMSGIIDVAWGFPIILVAIILAGALSPGLVPVILALSLVTWAGFARIIRGEVLSLREREFVDAARAVGASRRRILTRHLVPHLLAPSLVMGFYYFAIAIPAEAALAFIGLGAQPPTPSLGQMIAEGQDYLQLDVWLVLIPSCVLAVIVIGLNTLGDGLRDLLDPRLRARG